MTNDAGFSLIEVLVALVVLGIGAMSLLTSAENHVARVGGIEDRTVARWVAEDRLAALRLGVNRPDTVSMMGREWRVATRTTATSDPDLSRTDLAIFRTGEDTPLFQITGFIDQKGGTE